jgi:uncharacterized protein (TIGR02594 family)
MSPQWLLTMKAITGLSEDTNPGQSNPRIVAMAQYVGKVFPEQADYAALYTTDDTAWCGVACAFCMATAGISGPFGSGDTNKWMWAEAWSSDPGYIELSRPVAGCITVFRWSSGSYHVSLYDSDAGDGYINCRGGNQSNAVTLDSYRMSDVHGFYWPKDVTVPEIPVEDRPMLERGDEGPDVTDLQGLIPNFTGEIDGDFGSVTEDNVMRYQSSRGLEVDGIVGQETWQALYDDKAPLPPPVPPPGALTAKQQADIRNIAKTSKISSYAWEDRGIAPTGWMQGMALAFAQSYKKLLKNHPAVVEMSKARTNNDKDALFVYRVDFSNLGMSNMKAGVDTLRHLYALMLGHGMRESSGEHCCGRDQSASNYDSTTCEAGAFQTSYNAAGASNPEFDNLMDEYLAGQSPGYLEAFSEGVSCSDLDWESYGSGRGKSFQDLCKNAPAFSAESAGLTLRNLCNHYGPIVRKEVELKRDADTMFKDVQNYMDKFDLVA